MIWSNGFAMMAGFASPYAGPCLMMPALSDDGRRIRAGRIEYAPAFASLA